MTTLPTRRLGDARANKQVAALAYVGNVERADRDEAALHWLHVAEEVELGCGEGAERFDGPRARLVSLDRRMSRVHARITAHDGGWTLADAGSRNGTFADGERIERLDLVGGELIETGRTFWRFLRVPMAVTTRAMASREARIGPTRTICPALVSELAALDKVSQGTVLLLGETGTGKEMLAQQIHARSGRAGGFHAINCGALPATMIESELFGHRRGAFTGATDDKTGRIEAAQGGTLLLDEVGDLPPDAQVKLLRVLEEHRVTRLGETRPRPIDVRFVAATHHDLPALVEARKYRRDLYARLAGFTLRLPPLRDRKEDLGILVAHFLAQGAPAALSSAAYRRIMEHSWPMNVRELGRVLGTARDLARGGEAIDLEHLRGLEDAAPKGAAGAAPSGSAPPDEFRQRVEALLAEHGGNVVAVARALGKSRMQVYRWLTRWGLR